MQTLPGDGKKTAVITGASSGIGRATALYLAGLGFELIICSRNGDKLAGVVEEIRAGGGVAEEVAADVSMVEGVGKLAAAVKREWQHLDVLFNNAGMGRILPLEETADDLWFQTINTSLYSTFACCRELMPLLKAAQGGLIINNASIAAHRGFPNFSAYSAAKGGILSFSRSIREELRPFGIRVTTLSMGAVDSDFWINQEGEWNREQMMTCESVAELIGSLVQFPQAGTVEEITIMPQAGAL